MCWRLSQPWRAATHQLTNSPAATIYKYSHFDSTIAASSSSSATSVASSPAARASRRIASRTFKSFGAVVNTTSFSSSPSTSSPSSGGVNASFTAAARSSPRGMVNKTSTMRRSGATRIKRSISPAPTETLPAISVIAFFLDSSFNTPCASAFDSPVVANAFVSSLQRARNSFSCASVNPVAVVEEEEEDIGDIKDVFDVASDAASDPPAPSAPAPDVANPSVISSNVYDAIEYAAPHIASNASASVTAPRARSASPRASHALKNDSVNAVLDPRTIDANSTLDASYASRSVFKSISASSDASSRA
mmetsp:Transcript_7340/g.26777  ORF Transcript_7340/g.26777 Transcript_7340/m.26777 type:complete len:306 (-) Transcript_7340:25-942(-)